MHDALRLLAALAPVALLQTTVAAQETEPEPLILEIHYDDLLDPSDPDYDEVLAFVRYPLGSGPVSMGYPAGKMPVFLTARGGNSNSLVSGQPVGSSITQSAVDAGFVDVFFNYPEVDSGEDYRVAADGVGLLVQWLRHYADDLNLRTDQMTLQARSFGTIVSYSVALGADRADPLSADPVRRESSRMNYFVPRYGPSTLNCFSSILGAWASSLNSLFFPGKTFGEASPEEIVEESANWWLLNPRRFDRAWTPPMFVVYRADHDDVCGEIDDVHSGLFGELMVESMDDFARATGDWVWRDRSRGYDNQLLPDPTGPILAWAIERVAEDFGGLYLAPPVGSPGGDVSLRVFQAEPNSPVTFFSGTVPGNFPITGCPLIQGELIDFVEVGTGVAQGNGLAEVTFPVSAAAVGQTIQFHAVDLSACESSNVYVHQWQ